MSKTDHLAKAKDYIAEGEDSYRKAADEILAAQQDQPGLGYRKIATRVGKSEAWCRQLVQWRTTAQDATHPPFGGPDENEARYERQARTALKNPERRREAMASLSTEQLDEIATEATETLIERNRARQAEHRTEPTVRELMGGERFDPAENWADNLILRVHTNARALDRQIARAGGLILGSLTREEAFEYLQEAERQIAEARAAVQEQIRDEVQV